MQAIEVRGLAKSYADVKAVRGIDFSVAQGELFAFLGPNGAGKSTTIDILCTLLKQDAGSVHINGLKLGKDDMQIRRQIGVVFQNGVLDPFFTVRENLQTRGRMYGLKGAVLQQRIQAACNAAECNAFLDRRYSKLSGGQKRRADIARALINQPQILFLDEPTTGLDPKTRKSVWECISGMQKNAGMTVFLTTHYMEEAVHADHVVVIDKGKIKEADTPVNLRARYTHDRLLLYGASEQAIAVLQAEQIAFEHRGDHLHIRENNQATLLQTLNKTAAFVEGFEVIKGNMDDVFLNILSKEDAACGT